MISVLDLGGLLDSAADPILAHGPRGDIQYANRAAHDLAGCEDGALIGKPLTALLPQDVAERLCGWIASRDWERARPPHHSCEAIMRADAGARVYLEVKAFPFTTAGGDRLCGVLLRDITRHKEHEAERERLIQQLRGMAMVDPLTGLANRRALAEIVAQHEAAARRKGRVLSFAIADLDHFKRVNDTYGHHAGDEVLRQAAARFRRALRATDTVGRIGGEEFRIMLPETGLEEAALVLERVRRAFEEERVVLASGDEIGVTLSIGLASSSAEEGAERALLKADRALYRAKSSGRNRVCAAEPPEPVDQQLI